MLGAIQDFEKRHQIDKQQTEDSLQWSQVAKVLKNRTYHHCLDTLEEHIVAWMFQLTKMNMSEPVHSLHLKWCLLRIIGYRQCKHIVRALKVHFKAICTALNKYSIAAQALALLRPGYWVFCHIQIWSPLQCMTRHLRMSHALDQRLLMCSKGYQHYQGWRIVGAESEGAGTQERCQMESERKQERVCMKRNWKTTRFLIWVLPTIIRLFILLLEELQKDKQGHEVCTR